MVSTDWSTPEWGSLVTAAGPDISTGVAPSGFAAFLGLELKHNRGLDFISSLTKILPL